MTITRLTIPHHGREVHAALYLPEADGPVPAVLMSHGYNGCMTDFDGGARFLAENGIASLCYTFCGGSTRDESGFPTTEMTLFTEREDALALLDFLRGHDAVDAAQVYLFGGSMGGMVSVLASQERPEDIAGLALLFPALCIPDNWNTRFPNAADIPETVDFWGMTLGRGFFTSMREMDVFARMPEYPRSVLIMQGDQDPVVSMADSERAVRLYRDAELRVFPGEGHGFTQEADAEVFRMLLAFVKKGGLR
ncbi:MAG: alpha/beta hydrolase [Clostridiales bacterium]|nr:alpha/beta hydrolase [Clostridiales bacterium]